MINNRSCVLTTLYGGDSLDLFEIAIGSIEAQTGLASLPNIYLCIDGPLRAEQNEWLTQNQGRFYRVFRKPTNEGLAAALNDLLDIVEDETYAFRMDGDDISHPERFARQIARMQTDPALALLGCQAVDIDEHGKKLGDRFYPTESVACVEALKSINPILHPTFCLRMDAVREHHLRYPQAYLSEDLAFVVTMVARGLKIGNLPDQMFSWRLGPNFFARRRSMRRGWVEMKWYSRAVYARKGLLTVDYVYPVMRMVLRCLPSNVQSMVYKASLRSKLASTVSAT